MKLLPNIERSERVYAPTGSGSYKKLLETPANAPTHEEGGIDVNLPQGSLVFPKQYLSELDKVTDKDGSVKNSKKFNLIKNLMLDNAAEAAASGKPYSSGGAPTYRDGGGMVKYYGDGGEVDLRDMYKANQAESDLKRLKRYRDNGLTPEQGMKINAEFIQKYGEDSAMMNIAQPAIHEAYHQYVVRNGGYNMDEQGMKAGSGVKYQSAIIENDATLGNAMKYVTGKSTSIDPQQLMLLYNPGIGTRDTTPTATGTPPAPTVIGAPTPNMALPRGATVNPGNKGIVSGQQEILNQMIAKARAAGDATAPILLKTDDVMGAKTRAAMDWAEKQGMYKTPELLSAANVEQYKKNWAQMSAADKQKAIGSTTPTTGKTIVPEKVKEGINKATGSGVNYLGAPMLSATRTGNWQDNMFGYMPKIKKSGNKVEDNNEYYSVPKGNGKYVVKNKNGESLGEIGYPKGEMYVPQRGMIKFKPLPVKSLLGFDDAEQSPGNRYMRSRINPYLSKDTQGFPTITLTDEEVYNPS